MGGTDFVGEIVNLRHARKRRRRQDKDAAAAENRSRFGRPKATKQRDEQEAERANRQLDGHRRDDPAGNGHPGGDPDDTGDDTGDV